jgi:predicted dehydrogenase
MDTDTGRRDFLRAAGATALSASRVAGANDRLRIGTIGAGGRATYITQLLVAPAAGAELVAVSDAYEPRRAAIRQKLGPNAREFPDYRALLDQKDIDAVVIGSPDHWHVPMTIDAIHAGKDVYVEKPVSHTIEEGARLAREAGASRRIVQVGYQQRSWDHFQVARDVIASGRLGKITQVLASWYQNYPRWMATPVVVEREKLDWKAFLGSAPDQPFNEMRFMRWRWFWDFGGGHLTDLYSHWIDTIHWFMNSDSPLSAQAMGESYLIREFECPDTVSASYTYPGGWMAAYTGTLSGHLEGGNIVFRGSRAMMKISRDGFAVYSEGVVPAEATRLPEPDLAMRSRGDGTADHARNFAECVKSRKAPNAPLAGAIAAARAAHLGNLALRKGTRIESR